MWCIESFEEHTEHGEAPLVGELRRLEAEGKAMPPRVPGGVSSMPPPAPARPGRTLTDELLHMRRHERA